MSGEPAGAGRRGGLLHLTAHGAPRAASAAHGNAPPSIYIRNGKETSVLRGRDTVGPATGADGPGSD